MQLIPLKNFNVKTCFIQFLRFFLKCWLKGQIISRNHLSLPNAYTLICFDRNINVNRDVKFFEWAYWSLHWWKNLTLVILVNDKTHRWLYLTKVDHIQILVWSTSLFQNYLFPNKKGSTIVNWTENSWKLLVCIRRPRQWTLF